MSLSILNYIPSVTGSQIDGLIKASSGLLPDFYLSSFIWEQMLTVVYNDFKSILSNSIKAYILTATVEFPTSVGATIPMTIPVTNVELSPITNKAKLSSNIIDAGIKAVCAGTPNNNAALLSLGPRIWKEVIKQVITDIIDVFPNNIANAITSAQVMAPAGAMAGSVIALLASAPATLMNPIIGSKLKSEMNSYFTDGLNQSYGILLDTNVKSRHAQYTGMELSRSQTDGMGEIIWDEFIDIVLKRYIKTGLEITIRNWLTIPGMNWATPNGIPGPPFTPFPTLSGPTIAKTT